MGLKYTSRAHRGKDEAVSCGRDWHTSGFRFLEESGAGFLRAPPSLACLTFSLNHDLWAQSALKASGHGTRYENSQRSDQMDTTAGNRWPVVNFCLIQVSVDGFLNCFFLSQPLSWFFGSLCSGLVYWASASHWSAPMTRETCPAVLPFPRRNCWIESFSTPSSSTGCLKNPALCS